MSEEEQNELPHLSQRQSTIDTKTQSIEEPYSMMI